MWYTQGFNPHIYMTFAAPLALGQESLVESLDCRMEPLPGDWEQARAALQACLPGGGARGEAGARQGWTPPKLPAPCMRYSTRRRCGMPCGMPVQAYNALSQALVEKKGKKGKTKQIDLKQYLPALELVETEEAATVPVELPAGNTLTVNPALLLNFLEKETGLPSEAPRILRVALKTQEGEIFC